MSTPFERRQALARVAGRQRNVLTRAQARACGYSDQAIKRLLANGEWQRPFPRVFVVARSDPSWKQTLLAACLSAGQGVAASHATAGELWSLEGVRHRRLDISTTRRVRLRSTTVRVHQTIRPFSIHTAEGFPVTTVTRTLIDLASVLEAGPLEVALEDAVRRRLTTTENLMSALRRYGGRGRPGTASLKAILASGHSARPTDSGLEVRVARALVAAGLPPPRRQHPVAGPNGFAARIDLAYPEVMLGIEVDGFRYHSGRGAWSRDRRRRNALSVIGWTVLHATKEDLAGGCTELVASVRGFLGQTQMEL